MVKCNVAKTWTESQLIVVPFSPQGTLIIQNLNSVLNEEGQWKSPHEFNIENFLNDQGEFDKPEAFMPFSAGIKAQALVFMSILYSKSCT